MFFLTFSFLKKKQYLLRCFTFQSHNKIKIPEVQTVIQYAGIMVFYLLNIFGFDERL